MMKHFKLLFILLFCLLPITAWADKPPKIDALTKQADKQVYKMTRGEDNDEVSVDLEQSPKITFTKWNKENSLSIKIPDELIKNAKAELKDGKLEYKNGKIGFYSNPDGEDNFKFGLILYEKPTTNTWSFQLEGWEEFDFYYQPPLKNLNPDGSTWEETKQGVGNRPAEVNGSYAIYAKNKCGYREGGANYRTGKLGHIYRPKFVDADGKWEWGLVHIESGVYTVSVSQSFLDSAEYPVKANDTFGQTNIGGSNKTFETYYGCNANEGDTELSNENGGTITKYTIYGRVGSGTMTVQLVAYSMREGDPGDYWYPVNRIGTPGTATITTTAGWRDTGTVSHSMSVGTAYCVAFGNASTAFTIYYDTGPDSYQNSVDGTTSSMPATWAEDFTDNEIRSIYATYTPAGAAAPQGQVIWW